MASLLAAAVAVLKQWEVGDRQGRENMKAKRCTVTLTGQGGTTNQIPASAFGFTELFEVSGVVTDGDTWLPAAINYAGDAVLLFNPNQATDANRANPADVTDTVRMTVYGF